MKVVVVVGKVTRIVLADEEDEKAVAVEVESKLLLAWLVGKVMLDSVGPTKNKGSLQIEFLSRKSIWYGGISMTREVEKFKPSGGNGGGKVY